MKISNVKILIFALTAWLTLGIGFGVALAQDKNSTTTTTADKNDWEVFKDNLFELKEASEVERLKNELLEDQKQLIADYTAEREALLQKRQEAFNAANDAGIKSLELAHMGTDERSHRFYSTDGVDSDTFTNLTTQYEKINEEIAKLDADFLNRDSAIKEQLAVLNRAGKGDIYAYKDPNTGSVTYFEKKGDSFVSVSGAMKGCVPLPAKLAEAKSCLFCPLFTIIFNTAQQMATAAYSSLSFPMAQVMILGFAIWVAFKVLLQVSSFTKQDGPKFLTELLIQGFKVFVAFVLLTGSSAIFTYVVGPILNAGLEFGTAMLFDIQDSKIIGCKSMEGVVGEPGVLPSYLHTKLLCFIMAVQHEIAMAQSIATSLMCVGITGLNIFKWDYSMFFQGLVIFIFSWLIMLAFAFYLIDATVRLGIVGTLIPFLIACWPFNATRKYTSKGWEMFLNTFFTYVFAGLVIMVNIKLMGQALSGGKGGIGAIIEALNGDEVQTLKDLLDIGFAGFLILIGCCIFGLKLSGQASELAGGMASAPGSAIGSAIGVLGASAAKALGKGALKTGKSVAWDSATSRQLRSKAWNATGGKAVNFAKKHINNARDKIGAAGAEGLDFHRQISGRGKTSGINGSDDAVNNPPITDSIQPTPIQPDPIQTDSTQTDTINPDTKAPINPDTKAPINSDTSIPVNPNPNATVNTDPKTSGNKDPNKQSGNGTGGGANVDDIKAKIANLQSQINALGGTKSNPVSAGNIGKIASLKDALSKELAKLAAAQGKTNEGSGVTSSGDQGGETIKTEQQGSGSGTPNGGDGKTPTASVEASAPKAYNDMNDGEKAEFVDQAVKEFNETDDAKEYADRASGASARANSYRDMARQDDQVAAGHAKDYDQKSAEFDRRDKLSPEEGGFKDEKEREFEKGRVDAAKEAGDKANHSAAENRAKAGEQDAIATEATQEFKTAQRAYVKEKIDESNNQPKSTEQTTSGEQKDDEKYGGSENYASHDASKYRKKAERNQVKADFYESEANRAKADATFKGEQLSAKETELTEESRKRGTAEERELNQKSKTSAANDALREKESNQQTNSENATPKEEGTIESRTETVIKEVEKPGQPVGNSTTGDVNKGAQDRPKSTQTPPSGTPSGPSKPVSDGGTGGGSSKPDGK